MMFHVSSNASSDGYSSHLRARPGKAFLRQNSYESDLERDIEKVERSAIAVREEASQCAQYVIGSIDRKMDLRG